MQNVILTSPNNYQPLSNTEYKSTVFTTYFGMPEHAVSLYRFLSNDDTVQPEDLEFVTLGDALYLNRKNDLAFTSRGKALIISEHQSTLNPNMPLRSVIYYGRTMEQLIPANSIYKADIIKIPTPEFYVFYNGIRNQPAEQILNLSNAYIEKPDQPMLDLTVKMINVNPSVHHPILQKSQSMYEYSTFVQTVREYRKPSEPLTNAIKPAILDCMQKGIMTDFLQKHGSEVVNMLFTEFNMEEALQVRGEEQFALGHSKGVAEGVTEGKLTSEIHSIRSMLAKQLSVSDIADLLTLSETYVNEINQLIQAHPDASDTELAKQYIQK